MMRRSSFTIWAAISGCLLGTAGRSVSFAVFSRSFRLLLVICSLLSSPMVSPLLRWGVGPRPLLPCGCCDGRAGAAGGRGL